jgi:hypothetical protein
MMAEGQRNIGKFIPVVRTLKIIRKCRPVPLVERRLPIPTLKSDARSNDTGLHFSVADSRQIDRQKGDVGRPSQKDGEEDCQSVGEPSPGDQGCLTRFLLRKENSMIEESS